MGKQADMAGDFNSAASALPDSDFCDELWCKYSPETTQRIFEVFKKLGIPAPEEKTEFMEGTAGFLVFMSQYGLVLRIEGNDNGMGSYDRINDTPWVLRPLASLDAGECTIEICPGCRPTSDQQDSRDLYKTLGKENILFFDYGARNMGYVPVKAPHFPKGIPVVTDRGAVRRLTKNVKPVKLGLLARRRRKAAEEALAEIYQPLVSVLEEGLQGRQPMRRFWDMCRDYVASGKLVAGWNEVENSLDAKEKRVPKVAAAYGKRLSP